MGWSIGYDTNWKRDIGYGVPAICDHPGCGEEIDRGLSHVCGDEPYGGDKGCGLYFCERHQQGRYQRCLRCARYRKNKFSPTPDVAEWMAHKLNDESWARWRAENPAEVAYLRSVTKPMADASSPAVRKAEDKLTESGSCIAARTALKESDQ